jgi:hypothetical protein
MILKRIALPYSIYGFHFPAPLKMTRLKNIDTAVLHCLWPDCRCEQITQVVEFIQHGWWDDQHVLIVVCNRCHSASGFAYQVTEPSGDVPGFGVIFDKKGD